MRKIFGAVLLALGLAAFAPAAAHADGGACVRPQAGSDVQRPPDLYSQNGKLIVAMNYYTSMDAAGRTLFCFVTTDGLESPTLHVNPGDSIHIHLTNMLTPMPGGAVMRVFMIAGASIGIAGTLAGFLIGTLFCANIESIRQGLSHLTGTTLFDPTIYFLERMPARMEPDEVAAVVLMALTLSFLATLYPAWRAARLDPVEALRYE